jgi:hypothetical protein
MQAFPFSLTGQSRSSLSGPNERRSETAYSWKLQCWPSYIKTQNPTEKVYLDALNPAYR